MHYKHQKGPSAHSDSSTHSFTEPPTSSMWSKVICCHYWDCGKHEWQQSSKIPNDKCMGGCCIFFHQITYHSSTSVHPALLFFLLGGLLLGGRGLGGLGGLGLGGGLGRGQRLLGGLLGRGLLLLGVGGEGGCAAGDVDVLAVVGHVLQGELGAVAGAQTHRAGSQGGCSLAHFWWEGRQSGGIRGEEGNKGGMKLVRQWETEGFSMTVFYWSSQKENSSLNEMRVITFKGPTRNNGFD